MTQVRGQIRPNGYLHINYFYRRDDGRLDVWDNVVLADEWGNVSFELRQGVTAEIKVYDEIGGVEVATHNVQVPMTDTISLDQLLS